MFKTQYCKKPVSIYGFDFIEHKALAQFRDCMAPDFVLAGSCMPDMHLGYTMPIGGVVQTDSFTLVPSWVGYDIGCGVSGIRTTFRDFDIRSRSDEIFDNIYKLVPTGRNWNKETQRMAYLEGVPVSTWMGDELELGQASQQVGTLGSGNHFIEIGIDMFDAVWIVVHSGSRNIGHRTATRYIKEACGHATGEYKCKEGSYPLVVGTDVGNDYLTDLNFCQEFAMLNRRAIMERVETAIQSAGADGCMQPITLINKNHNSAELALTPHGKGFIHRKGATDATESTKGIIPGNMRDGCYIVNGRGNVDSLFSASHGAGRVGSRREAKEATTLQAFEESMSGIKGKISLATLDENPLAYKHFDTVMQNQSDCIQVIDKIQPLINVKA